MHSLWSLFCAGLLLVPQLCAAAAPQRVMSLNLCADQLLLALLPEQRIASLSWLSQTEGDPYWLTTAQRLPANHGTA